MRGRSPIGNGVGAEGTSALSESLKQNTTLVALNFEGMCTMSWNIINCILYLQLKTYACLLTLCLYSDNCIGVEGARAVAECLKLNTTLTTLILNRVLELHKIMLITTQRDI